MRSTSHYLTVIGFVISLFLAAACHKSGSTNELDSDSGDTATGDTSADADSDSDSDSDADSDTDTDADTDSDADMDTDSDTDTDTDSDSDSDTDFDTESNTGNDVVEFTWVSFPGGTYTKGNNDGEANQKPEYDVTVPPFDILKTEVTVDQYAACVDASACTESISGMGCNWNLTDRGAHPINCVNWYQAKAFCQWIDPAGSLPSESQWEYAARSGGKDKTYPWGEDKPTCDLAVIKTSEGLDGCGFDSTFAVCSKTPGNTEQELCDMSGNVSEWVEDCVHPDYTDNPPTDGSAWTNDCAHTETDTVHITRGGSWMDRGSSVSTTFRTGYFTDAWFSTIGFRCVRQ